MSPQSECSVLDQQPEAPRPSITNSWAMLDKIRSSTSVCYHRTILVPLLSHISHDFVFGMTLVIIVRRTRYSSAELRDKPGFMVKIPHVPKLLDQVRDVLRMKHYSLGLSKPTSTDQTLHLFHDKRHPAEMGEAEIDHLSLTSQAKGRWRLRRQTVA